MKGATYTAILLALLLAGVGSSALAHEPGASNELPGIGTVHELRITSLTSLTVAQQVNTRIICPNPGACLQDEIHLPLEIDFATGFFGIDATEPEDENEVVSRILFNTQSGPGELFLDPPCADPDGCVGGTSVYLGTIDDAGNVFFDSISLSFDVFGLSPVAMFNGPMSTGTLTDSADPSVEAIGSPIDFNTGEITLTGIQIVDAPVVGTILQLNKIVAQIVPVPVPPVPSKNLLKCQKKIQGDGAKFIKNKHKELTKCVNALLECEILDETGVGAGASCNSSAVSTCSTAVERITKAENKFRDKILKSCKDPLGPANLVATSPGLGFANNQTQCNLLGRSLSSKEEIADCVVDRLKCSAEEMLALLEPRSGEVLAANGFGQFVDPNGCVPLFPDGNAAGGNAEILSKCQQKLAKEGGKLIRAKQKELQKCVQVQLACELQAEIDGLEGAGLATCRSKAGTICASSQAKIDKALTSFESKIQKSCPAFDTAFEQGLGFSSLAGVCGTLSSLDDLIQCLQTKLACAVDGVARSLEPRAPEVLDDPNGGGSALLDAFVCVAPSCGDGIVDAGESCDSFFPSEACQGCIVGICGNGVIEGNEECDDGNNFDFDGCSSSCAIEPTVCGDGLVEGNEVCDDSDSHGGDGCSARCLSDETCGNGVIDTIVGETCDDGSRAYDASLDGPTATPAVVTSATGSATFDLDPNNALVYTLTTTNLVDGVAAHIHEGFPGVPGPIIFPLVGGPTMWSGKTSSLTATELDTLRAGGYYVNVHTNANPGGEIRGQLELVPTAPQDGDGCSADCLSDETCGNGVIDSVTGEACDDGNTDAGDGCDASCQFESCSFFNFGALGTRNFTIDLGVGGLFSSIVGLGNPVGPLNLASASLDLVAGPTDASGNATVTLASDVIVGFDVSLGGIQQCLKFEATGSIGTLHCCGGHAVDTLLTRDSNTGGTGGNGPRIILTGIGSGGIGDFEMAFSVREGFGTVGDGSSCLTASFGSPADRFSHWTTGTATGQVIRPLQNPSGVFEFSDTGQAFDCSAWTTSEGLGKIVNADDALNAVFPILDAVNVRFFDDNGGN